MEVNQDIIEEDLMPCNVMLNKLYIGINVTSEYKC